jgi:excisionase family DNA binding protein
MGLIDSKELAKELKVSVQTVRRWTRTRRIPHIKIGPKTVRYNMIAVIAELSIHKRKNPERTAG